MKKLLTLITIAFLFVGVKAQYPNPAWEPNVSINGTGFRTMINARFKMAYDSLSAQKLLITSNTSAHTLNFNGILSLQDSISAHSDSIAALREAINAIEAGEADMVYPGTGIPLSTGSAWGTSITNNSANWNSAYGWGDHGTEGYLTSVGISDIDATGTPSGSTYLRGDGTWNTPTGSGTGLTEQEVADMISDSLQAQFDEAELGVAMTDTTHGTGFVETQYRVDTAKVNIRAEMALIEGGTVSEGIEPIFFFNAGHMRDEDSTIFMGGQLLGAWYNRSEYSYVVESVVSQIYGGAEDTLKYRLMWSNKLYQNERTYLTTDEIIVAADEYGYGNEEIYVFDNDTIPPNVTVYAMVEPYSSYGRPRFASITVAGKKIADTWNANPFNEDRTAPVLLSLEVGDFNDSIIVAIFSEELAGEVSTPDAFGVMVGNLEPVEWAVEIAHINEDTLFIAMDSKLVAAYADSTIQLTYTPGAPYLQDLAGNQVAAFDSVVVNNLAPDYPLALDDGDTEAWYIADAEYITVANDTAVTQWDDISGNNNHLAPAAENARPTFRGDSVYFDGTDDRISKSTLTQDSITTPYSIYYVASLQNQPTSKTYIQFGTGSPFIGTMNAEEVTVRARFAGGTNIDTPASGPSFFSKHLGHAILNGANSVIKLNNNTATTGSLTNTKAIGLLVGTFSGGPKMNFYEIIVRSGIDSSSDSTAITNYLNEKWTLWEE